MVKGGDLALRPFRLVLLQFDFAASLANMKEEISWRRQVWGGGHTTKQYGGTGRSPASAA